MYFEYTDAEKEKIQRIEDEYAQKIRDLEAKIKALRDDEPPLAKIEELHQRAGALNKKLPKDKKSAEYKKLSAEIERLDEEAADIFDEWDEAGSDEWKEARIERNRAESQLMTARYHMYLEAEDRYFASLGNNQERIYRDALRQAYLYIEDTYGQYESKLVDESYVAFRAVDVRLQEDGTFLLDKEKARENILQVVKRHLEALKDNAEYLSRFDTYLDITLSRSAYIGEAGVLGGEVQSDSLKAGANKVKKYAKPITRVQRKIFENATTLSADELDPIEDAWPVLLNRQRDIKATVSVDYNALVESGLFTAIPKLTGFDEDVYNALCSHWYAGNKRLSYDMIYRAMTGKVDGNIRVTEDQYAQIDSALNKFRAPTVLEYSEVDDAGNVREFSADEPLVQFKRGKIKINGNVAARAIEITSEPVLFSWGLFNHNEISTRDIKLLDVPGLNNGEESATIRRVLYARVDKMRHIFEKSGKKKEIAANLRRIRYDYVYDALELKAPDKNKRRLVKDKIDRILKYWVRPDFISGKYEHIRDLNGTYYAVDVYFLSE